MFPKNLILHPLVLLVLLSPLSAASPEALCISIEQHFPDAQKCLLLLAADPNSRYADDHRLAVIASRQTLAKGTALLNRTAQLAVKEPDGFVKMAMLSCVHFFSFSVQITRVADDYTAEAEYKLAMMKFGHILVYTKSCREAFGKKPGTVISVDAEIRAYETWASLAFAVAVVLGK